MKLADRCNDLRTECWKTLQAKGLTSGSEPLPLKLEPRITRESWMWIARRFAAVEKEQQRSARALAKARGERTPDAK